MPETTPQLASDAPPCSPSSDTPETDAESGFLPFVRAEFAPAGLCRKLEIERNDARRDRDEWKASAAQYHAANKWFDQDRSRLLRAIREMRPEHPILPENNQ